MNPVKGLRMRGTRNEIPTAGFDPSLQGVASDPFGGGYNVGLRIPATPASTNIPRNRFLYMLSMMRVNANQKVRLVGMRQLVTIGQFVTGVTGNYPLELEVTSPFWHFSDANITWYIQQVGPLDIATINTNSVTGTNDNAEGFQFGYAETPALLYQTSFTDVGGYVPPNGGNPYGTPLIPGLSNFHDLRAPWRSSNAWNNSLDIQAEGPCDIALFASVQQTDPAARTIFVPPAGSLPFVSPEDAFVATFASSVYWRIAGSLIFENSEFYDTPKGNQEFYETHEIPPCNVRRDPCGDR